MTKLTANDVATVPPVDKDNEMQKAANLLRRFRKQLNAGDVHKPGGNGLSVEWQRWIAQSLLSGIPEAPTSDLRARSE